LVQDVANDAEQKVGVQASLVDFVNYNMADIGERRHDVFDPPARCL